MDHLNDLKILWKEINTDILPKPKEMVRMAKSFRNQKIINKIGLITGSIFLILLLSVAIYFIRPKLLITQIGIGLVIISGLILFISNILSINRFIQFKNYSNKEFLAFLEQTRRNQLFFHNKTQVVGLLLSSLGLLLYNYEFVHKNPLFLGISYSISLGFILFIWFYLRPRKFKNQLKKINETIEKLKSLSNQIE